MGYDRVVLFQPMLMITCGEPGMLLTHVIDSVSHVVILVSEHFAIKINVSDISIQLSVLR